MMRLFKAGNQLSGNRSLTISLVRSVMCVRVCVCVCATLSSQEATMPQSLLAHNIILGDLGLVTRPQKLIDVVYSLVIATKLRC
jgi:hypothetical protein